MALVSYRFERGEPVPEAIKRLAKEQVEGAVESLGSSGNRDESIHDARKRVKKTRALLRLVREELGDAYTAENIRLRDAARGLSEFRDAAAVIQTFDSVREKYRDEFEKRPLDSIRQGLLLRKQRAERKANFKETLARISAVLSSGARQAGKWPLTTDGFAAVAPGFQQALRRGRKAMHEAHAQPAPASFHLWRKRVKDHWYHIRLLEDLWPDVMGGYEKALKQLEDWLGSDHNLAVLHDKVAAEPDFYGSSEDIEKLVELTAKYQKELRGCAMNLGARVYMETPGRLTKRMAGLWDAWQEEKS